jgi:dTDP-4-dehydrorhamnose 3,5-epimerase
MIFTETALPGAYVIDIEARADERGYFARGWCEREFREHGITAAPVQVNLSYNHRAGTLRGMHYQRAPWAESKLVRCTRGAIYDVIIDLRPESPTYRRWIGVELGEETARMLFVPEGFAHGFVTLADATAVTYQVSQFYTPGAEAGIRWDDPAFAIEWPVPVRVISEKDRSWPDFADAGDLAKAR